MWDDTNFGGNCRLHGKGSTVRGADLRNKRPIIPKHVDAKKFLKLLKINQIEKESLKNGWVSLDFLYQRYGQRDGFKNYRNLLCNQGGEEAWKTNGCFAFMVTFLGLIIFPKRDEHIDIRLADVIEGVGHNGKSNYYSYDPGIYVSCID